MNKVYLANFYEKNKEALLESEQNINSQEELIDYIHSTVSSNILYDFGIDIDLKELFKGDKKILEAKEEEIEYEKD